MTAPPFTAPPSPSPVVAVTPATSPTPVPGRPTDPLDDGVWRTVLVMPDGMYPLPIVLHDATGLVTAIAANPPGIPAFDEGIANRDGQPDVLVYTWIGGACDGLATITFERAGDRFRLHATTDRVGEICILIGLTRQLVIQLAEPVDAALVNLDQG